MLLLIEGKIVRTATGPNDVPGGSETLAPDSWNVAGFAGKSAVIRIVDQATAGWGHISVDQIAQCDLKPAPRVLLTNAKRDFKIDQRYLNLPIKNGAPTRKVTTQVDGRPVVCNDIALADAGADW